MHFISTESLLITQPLFNTEVTWHWQFCANDRKHIVFSQYYLTYSTFTVRYYVYAVDYLPCKIHEKCPGAHEMLPFVILC